VWGPLPWLKHLSGRFPAMMQLLCALLLKLTASQSFVSANALPT
jgi:hypothetical protein